MSSDDAIYIVRDDQQGYYVIEANCGDDLPGRVREGKCPRFTIHANAALCALGLFRAGLRAGTSPEHGVRDLSEHPLEGLR